MPGESVWSTSRVARVVSHGSAANASYATTKSLWACAATVSPAWSVPVTGQLVCVMAVPGYTPTSPVMVPLVQVTAVPARTAKLAAAPSEGTEDALMRAASFEAVDGAADPGPHAREESTARQRRESP